MSSSASTSIGSQASNHAYERMLQHPARLPKLSFDTSNRIHNTQLNWDYEEGNLKYQIAVTLA
jgi:hypothetical protein